MVAPQTDEPIVSPDLTEAIDPLYRRERMTPYQLDAIFCEERYAAIEASTKSGKTHGCIGWLFEGAAQGQAHENFWWVAPIKEQARIAFERLKRALDRNVFLPNETRLVLRLNGRGTLWFKSADEPDHLYGDDVKRVVMDEASRAKEDAWHAVRSTLTATGGSARLIGNVKGRKNFFYRLARRAEAGELGWKYAKITAFDAVRAGILTAEEIEDARREYPENVFRELFLAEASDDAGNPFGQSHIRACIAPMAEGEPDVWAWDLGKHVDYTVGIGLTKGGQVCRLERWQKPWMDAIREIVLLTGGVRALVDSTGVGDPILEGLQQHGSNFEGFHFTPQSKQQIMEGLAVAIQQRMVTYPEGPIVNELESFEYSYTRTGVRYSAPEGLHDDCVCALAMAVRAKGVSGGAGWDVWGF